jgi:MoaA/NifB/PqqE/SkfB family radical SAM enzyme
MSKMKSLSLFVGTNKCNARCKHCAGIPLRQYAPKEDDINEDLFYKTIIDCYAKGASSLSISSSGEPTLSPISVTKTLNLINNSEVYFSPINLYSNGIRIGKDEFFSNSFLPLWNNLGLTTIYVTVHDIDEKKNAKIYGIENYPKLSTIVSRIHDANLKVRANLVLSKNNISTLEKFVYMVNGLQDLEVDLISAWPIRDNQDQVDKNLSHLEEELEKMDVWVENKPSIRLMNGKNRISYETSDKLTLFQNGLLSNTWCN